MKTRIFYEVFSFLIQPVVTPQRFIMFIPERSPMIVEAIQPFTIQIAVDKRGYRFIQQLFDKPDIDLLTPLVKEVLSCADKLAVNQ